MLELPPIKCTEHIILLLVPPPSQHRRGREVLPQKRDQTIHGSLGIAARWNVGAGGERQTRAGGHGVEREMETRTEREKRVMESCRQVGQEGWLAAGPPALSQRH